MEDPPEGPGDPPEGPGDPPEGQGDPDNPPLFWCHICSLACPSAVNLQSHFLGAKHKRAEEALKEDQEGGKEKPLKPEETLVDQINACRNAEPALGLEYIYEDRSYGYSRYQCKLCNCFQGRTNMFMHIIGTRHRIQYLEVHHPSMGISNASVTKAPKKLQYLRDICIKVEKDFGRKKINIVNNKDKTFRYDDPMPTLPCAFYKPDKKLKKMDFTTDEFMEVEEAAEEPEEDVVTFLKLKEEHEASQRYMAIGQGRSLQPVAEEFEKRQAGGLEKDQAYGFEKEQAGEPGKDQAGGPEEQAGEPEKDQAGGPAKEQAGEPEKDQTGSPEKGQKRKARETEKDQSDVDDAEPNPDLDNPLPSHKEVFEYLDSFEVHELKHIHFLIKATDKLRHSLTRYRNEEEKKKMEANNRDNNQTFLQQSLMTQEHPSQQGPIFPPGDFVRNPTPFVEETTTESANQGNQAMGRSANKPRKRNAQQKLSFRISAPPVEKNQMVSSELLCNLQQDFAAKSNPKKMMAASMACTGEENLTEDPIPSFKPVYDGPRNVVEQRFSSSNAQPRDTMAMPPERAGAGSMRGQFTNEGSAMVTPKVSYQRELLGYPSGSVTSRASSVHDPPAYDRTRDVQEQRFPSSKHHPGTSISQPRHLKAKPPDRAGTGSSRGPCPNQGFDMVSYPHDLLGNSTGSASARPSNVQEPFKKVSGFPSSPQERMRNSAPPYPPQEPMRTSSSSTFLSSKDMLRNSAGSSGPRTSDSFQKLENSTGACPPFLQQFTMAPRTSPPSNFPKDDATALFFESVKDMDISEVTSTLNKITATNPAFQKIHVPSLVRYLEDTGKISSPSNRPGNI